MSGFQNMDPVAKSLVVHTYSIKYFKIGFHYGFFLNYQIKHWTLKKHIFVSKFNAHGIRLTSDGNYKNSKFDKMDEPAQKNLRNLSDTVAIYEKRVKLAKRT